VYVRWPFGLFTYRFRGNDKLRLNLTLASTKLGPALIFKFRTKALKTFDNKAHLLEYAVHVHGRCALLSKVFNAFVRNLNMSTGPNA